MNQTGRCVQNPERHTGAAGAQNWGIGAVHHNALELLGGRAGCRKGDVLAGLRTLHNAAAKEQLAILCAVPAGDCIVIRTVIKQAGHTAARLAVVHLYCHNKELTRCTQITYLPDIRVHDLRHSHVSLCIELGYSIVLVAKRIGDTVPVVMRTYAHLYPNKQQELVSRLETLSTSSSSKDESDLMPLV